MPVVVNCRHWSPHPAVANAGRCGAAVYPGSLSAGVCRQCRLRDPVDPAAAAVAGDPSPPPSPWSAEQLATFRRLWRAIQTEVNPTLAWWAVHVLATLPCGECRAHTIAYAEAHPPPWGDFGAFRVWALGLLNSVRRRQGREPAAAL